MSFSFAKIILKIKSQTPFPFGEKNMKKERMKNALKSFYLGIFFVFSLFAAWCLEGALAAPASYPLISEVQIESAAEFGHYDDWVEIHNPTESDISVEGWSVQKTNESGGSFYRKALSGLVPANGYFLVVRDNASTSPELRSAADVLAAGSAFSLSEDNTVYLVNDNEDITDKTDPNIVDFAGLGAATSYEGSAAAPNPGAGESVLRYPAGEDTNDNSADFILSQEPTPGSGEESGGGGGDPLDGTVIITAVLAAQPVQNLGANSADIVFSVNAPGAAYVKYGPDGLYGNESGSLSVAENTEAVISLSGLECSTAYHYSVYAENSDGSEHDETADAVFTTLPCGITVDSLVMAKTGARANDDYASGWQWELSLTVWDMGEDELWMKFADWSGPMALSAGNNMRYRVNGGDYAEITAGNAYPSAGIDISGYDASPDAGRQITVYIEMKVPSGTLAGAYSSNYGVLTE